LLFCTTILTNSLASILNGITSFETLFNSIFYLRYSTDAGLRSLAKTLVLFLTADLTASGPIPQNISQSTSPSLNTLSISLVLSVESFEHQYTFDMSTLNFTLSSFCMVSYELESPPIHSRS
jgi:hypothetical protein